jgi:hypothetical protein
MYKVNFKLLFNIFNNWCLHRGGLLNERMLLCSNISSVLFVHNIKFNILFNYIHLVHTKTTNMKIFLHFVPI